MIRWVKENYFAYFLDVMSIYLIGLVCLSLSYSYYVVRFGVSDIPYPLCHPVVIF